MIARVWFCVVLLIALPGIVPAQQEVRTTTAELSIPFGVAKGYLARVGEYLVFVNTNSPETSFAVVRENLADVTAGDGTLTLRTNEPIRERSEFVFRLQDPAEVNLLANWARETPSTVAASGAGEGDAGVELSYQARHKHTLRGGCTGKLIVTASRVSYESISEIGHSRQWDLKDVKELRRANPYEIEIVPFVGNDYNIDLLQQGMSSRDYSLIVDRISSQRAPK